MVNTNMQCSPPVEPLPGTTHLEHVRRIFTAVSRLDSDGVLAALHPDFTFELPYEKGIGPLDKAGMGAMLNSLAGSFQRFTMHIVEVVEATDPNLLVLRYEGDCLSTDGTVEYRNSYVAFFYFTDGLVSHWREYTNPLVSRKMNQQLSA